MSVRYLRLALLLSGCLAGSAGATLSRAFAGETIELGIGTQDTTTNTVSTGVVIRKLDLLQKYLPKTGKYAGTTINVTWQNFTSGPPVTNGMMADKLQIGAMGDYPLLINGYTFSKNSQSHSQLIAIAGYNLYGSGNGVVVNKASSYFTLKDLKDKTVSVPFGSAAHGMILKAMHDEGLPSDYFRLVSQSPEVGSTNLQEQKIDAHVDFVPFPELLPFRGFARKIYDGVQTRLPTWHGVVVRTDFAAKYPEIVEAYLNAVIDANAWIKADPKRAAEKISEWTGTDKEVVYIFLGPGGIMTLDPTIKPQLIDAGREDVKVLQSLGRLKEFDVGPWVNDSYLKKVYAARGFDYSKGIAATTNYEVAGTDDFCKTPIKEPRQAGEIWIKDGDIKPFSSASCMMGAYKKLEADGAKIDVAYLFDHARGIKLFARAAFYVVDGKKDIVPFLLKEDAAAYAGKNAGTVMSFDDAMKTIEAKG